MKGQYPVVIEVLHSGGARTVSRCQMVNSAQLQPFFFYAAFILQQLQTYPQRYLLLLQTHRNTDSLSYSWAKQVLKYKENLKWP